MDQFFDGNQSIGSLRYADLISALLLAPLFQVLRHPHLSQEYHQAEAPEDH